MNNSITSKSDKSVVFRERLANAELKGLRLLKEALESYNEDLEDEFSSIIETVLKQRFTPAELAAEFKVSIGTVSRWRKSKSCPPSYARASIVNRLCEMLSMEITQKSEHLRSVSQN